MRGIKALIKGYTDYLVFDDGRVWSNKSNKFLKPAYTQSGYASVELFNDHGSKRKLVHRLVAEAFLPNPQMLPQINHKDENPRNNHLNNLEWCTAKYNMHYGDGAKTRHLKIDYSKPCYRENAIKNGKVVSKPTLQYDKNGNFIKRYESAKSAGDATGIDYRHIVSCCNKKKYRHTAGGFRWEYERSDDLLQFHA